MYEQGRDLLGALSDSTAPTILEAVYARDILFRGSVLEGLSVGLAALHRAEQSRNGALTVNVAGSLSFFLWATGRLAEVIEVTDRAFKMTRGDDRAGAGMTFACPVAQCEFTRMLAFGDLGRIDDPRASRRRAIALACEHGDPMIEIHTLTHSLLLPVELISFEALHDGVNRGVEAAERMGRAFTVCLALVLVTRAVCNNLQGKWAAAERDATDGLTISTERNVGLFVQPAILRVLAFARLGLGQTAAAVAAADEAVEQALQSGLATLEIAAQEMLARALWAHHGPKAIEVIDLALERAMSLAQAIGAQAWHRSSS
ncbi:MAG: hypothetical protein ABSG43_10975, partial [Solirubrobacteraceae bacterium]